MITDKKMLAVEVSERFHGDVKTLAIKKRTTVKQLVIEALVQYINKERSETV